MAKKKICLDPGHYGSYYNAGAVKGYYESACMFKLTMIEKEILEQMGYEVVLTRTDINADPELTARGRMAKGCVVMVSNHTNATDNKNINRAVSLHMVSRTDKTIDDISKALAIKLAKVVEETMGVDGNQCYSVMSSNDRDGDGVKNDNYYGVLHGAFTVGVPAIIMEHGFHTNPGVCNWLMNEANLRKLAKACCECIAEFVESLDSTNNTPAPKPAEEETRDYLMKGDKGAEVKEMQENLIDLGFSCGKYGADGDFGGDTEEAVRAFQEANKLVVDGLYGPKSKAKAKELLAKALAPSSKFPAVPFMVRVIIDDLNIRTAPSMDGKVTGVTKKGSFTIVEVRNGWGKLKSGAGWIYIENPKYCTVVK